MSEPARTYEGLSSWARYLHDAQSRPGWSIARIERQLRAIGKPISRATLFRMMADRVEHVSTKWVLAIAEVLGDDPQAALRAAGDLLDMQDEPGDRRLKSLGLEPGDPTVRKILSGPFDYDLQTEMLEKLCAKRAEQRELQLRQEAAEFEQYERFWRMKQAGR